MELRAGRRHRERVPRDMNGAARLAPGTTDAGFRGSITFNGALSYEGLFLVNGVVVNETVRGAARDLFIEDSIEETKTYAFFRPMRYGRSVPIPSPPTRRDPMLWITILTQDLTVLGGRVVCERVH